MGTTLTAVVPDGHGVLVGHVGDSRAYLLRDGELRQLTTDHSLVEELVREGTLTEEQAAVHPQRSIITRALGVEDDVEVDVYPVPLQPGDRLLLCSDGLTTMLRPDAIAGAAPPGVATRPAPPTSSSTRRTRPAARTTSRRSSSTSRTTAPTRSRRRPPRSVPRSPSPHPSRCRRRRRAPAPTARRSSADRGGTGDRASHRRGAAGRAAQPRRRSPTGLPEGASAAQGARRRERAERRQERDRHPVRSAGRFARFLVPIILILGLAVAVTAWYARRTYFVAFDRDGQVTVYQGRPGGLLLWDPTVDPAQRRSPQADLPEDALLDVEDQKEFADKGAAIAFVGRVEARATAATSTRRRPPPRPPTPAGAGPAHVSVISGRRRTEELDLGVLALVIVGSGYVLLALSEAPDAPARALGLPRARSSACS